MPMKNVKCHIYAVEDDEDDQLILKNALGEYPNVKLTFFNDGKSLLNELLDESTQQFPTLTLLDLDLPVLNGLEVLQIIRANSTLRHIPIIVFSSFQDPLTIFKVYNAGANSFISKPDSSRELDTVLNATLAYWLKTTLTPSQIKNESKSSGI